MPALDRNFNVTCGNCGISVTKKQLSRHKSSCSGRTLDCPIFPNFCTKSGDDLNHHIAKKHSIPRTSITFKCKLCHAEFPGFYPVRQHKNTQRRTQIGFGATNTDVEDIVGDVEDHRLREELLSCQHFLVDSEIEKARHKVYNYAIEKLNAEIVGEKHDQFFNNLKCAAKVILVFGFILIILEDGGFRYFYTHENNTLLE